MTPEAAEVSRESGRRKGSWWRRAAKEGLYLALLVLFIVAAAAIGGYLAYDYVTRPGVPGATVDLDVPAGATGRDVGVLLAKHGLIEHELFFLAAIKLEERRGTPSSGIKSGPYRVPRGLSPTQLLGLLHDGPNRALDPEDLPPEQKITIPEGLTVTQMAALFEDPEAFLRAARDPQLVGKADTDAASIEGFLMPNTYYFFDGKPDERAVVERMAEQFDKEYSKLLAEFPQAAEREKLEVVTVASLVEEEARLESERPLVAAVIYNRLEKKMPLQLDSTLQYALGKYGQRLLNEDKLVDSPYNTYKHPGLPPGPISNPGVSSLRAALNPADAGYLYFVSNADGTTHTFSVTAAEHDRAVLKFRREIAPQRRALKSQEQAP